MYDKGSFLTGLIIGALAMIIILTMIICDIYTHDQSIISGKEFIIDRASYKCTKTNELLNGSN